MQKLFPLDRWAQQETQQKYSIPKTRRVYNKIYKITSIEARRDTFRVDIQL